MTQTNDIYDPAKLDGYDYGENPTGLLKRLGLRFRKFLWFCAGADRQLLLHCPESERVKEEGIGGVVLATAVLAFFSGSYAFYTVFREKTGLALDIMPTDYAAVAEAIAFGLVWSAVIFNLDRFVVSSTGHGDGTDAVTFGEVFKALPRIAMAFVIGITLSKPLEIKILESEIKTELASIQKAKVQAARDQALKNQGPEVNRLTKLIADKTDRLNAEEQSILQRKADSVARRTRLEEEIQGKVGSGKAGKGPAAEVISTNIDLLEKQLAEDRARIDAEKAAKSQDIANLTAERKRALDSVDKAEADQRIAEANNDGLWRRIEIAHRIAPVMSWALTALLLLVEVSPIFFKMMLTLGPYDYLNENQKQMVLAKYGIQVANPTVAQDLSQLSIMGHVRHNVANWIAPASFELKTDASAAGHGGANSAAADQYHQAQTLLATEAGQQRVAQTLIGEGLQQYAEKRKNEMQTNLDQFLNDK